MGGNCCTPQVVDEPVRGPTSFAISSFEKQKSEEEVT